MKTTTYLRLSLLIPFLAWGACLLLFAITNVSPGTGGPVTRFVTIFFLFYLFGVIGWFLPYLLLSLILLIWSFKSRAETLIKIFALSPLAMAVFIIVFVIVVLGDRSNPYTPSPALAADVGEFFGSPLWFGIVTLAWGYICVGIGYGIYKLLQALRVIRDTPTPVVANTAEPA